MKKILVIEDEPEMRRNIATLVRYYDYAPIAAENGQLGVEAARRELPDLILCEVMMPELDGYGVLQAVQSDASLAGIPFVFLTAKGEKDDLRSGMNLSADDYLTKPVANSDLVHAIEARLRRSEFTPDANSSPIFRPLNLSGNSASLRAPPKPCSGSPKAKPIPTLPAFSVSPNPPSKSTSRKCSKNSASKPAAPPWSARWKC
jgi:DNA-binding response OmpR family regulator